MSNYDREFDAQTQSNSWSEYRRLVTGGLRDLDQDIKTVDGRHERKFTELADKLEKMQLQFTKDITELQTRAAMWGGIVGAIGGGVVTIIAQAIIHR